jgi:excinuclease ABC subunit A
MRCPACGGNGFEHVEMQFLSDVYIRCADCDGSRFRPEVLDVRVYPADGRESSAGAGGKSIADVLDMTVTEAVVFFALEKPVQTALQPLQAVGLGYLKLGQPVPTLSGGEAQRLKLAGHLAKAAKRRSEKSRMLFLFDEPTTGLHFDDVAVLLAAFRELLSNGHSIVVIEHHLDVVRTADWVIDLGPEGGEEGGEIVCEGPPDKIQKHRTSHTARALRREKNARRVRAANPPRQKQGTLRNGSKNHAISVHKAREHNLRNIDLEIPRNEFTVITGISGSGKSTVAFDILFAEGQRRYLESLNAYARQFVQPAARPDVDAIYGIPPTVAIEQRTSRGGRKSTVGTLTEGYHFLRLLFVKLGVQHCPDCDLVIRPQTPESIRARIQKRYRGRRVMILSPLVVSRKGYYTDLAKWAAGKGYKHLRVDGELIATDPWPRLDRFKEHDIELPVGELTVAPARENRLASLIAAGLDLGNGVLQVAPVKGPARARRGEVFSTLRACPGCGRSFDELDPRLFSYNSRHGWCSACYGTGLKMSGFDEEQTGEEAWWNEWWEEDASVCRACRGTRLRPEARAVRFRNRTISELNALSVEAALKFFSGLKITGRDAEISRDILPELKSRLEFLASVGLTYLTLDRSAPTLSGGEAQRIRLASQLGSNLRGVCYILDEPTIGLHARDNLMLLDTLQSLEKKGNTVVVVEHDEETIRRAGHVVDLGPGAGIHGGKVVAEGAANQVMRNKASITGRYLKHPLLHPLRDRIRELPAKAEGGWISVEGATLHNLRNVDARFPLGCLICVSGVSGSGKSTLVRDILHANLVRHAGRRRRKRAGKDAGEWSGCREIRGVEEVRRVLEVDQSPIGKTPRSCPATYVGLWDHVRRLYAESTESKIRGFGPGRFSFNVRGGRCPECEGQGMKKIEMNFLPDVKVPCDVCDGARFNPETLDVLYRDKSIGDLLAMSIDEAVEFFSAHASIHHTLLLLQDVGLGYLTLGQQSPTLSGGEAQRVKLVTELAKAGSGKLRSRGAIKTVYLLDEPTVGLHMADVEKLIEVMHRLVDAGNTVVVIEHHLDVIVEADWIIDLGPEGGIGGGRVVAQGPPARVASAPGKRSHTGPILSAFLAERSRED